MFLRRKAERNPHPSDPVFPNIETGTGLRDPSNTSDHLRDAAHVLNAIDPRDLTDPDPTNGR